MRDRLHRLLQHAVNAVLDDHRIVARLHVNITGAALQGAEDRGVHQADDGADVVLRRQLFNRDGLVAARVIVVHHVQRKGLAGLVQHALRLLGLLQDVGDFRQRGYPRQHPAVQQQADLVDHVELAGVAERNRQPSIFQLLQRHEVEAEHQLHRHLAEEFVLDPEPCSCTYSQR